MFVEAYGQVGGPGLLVLARGRCRARQGDQAAAGRRLLRSQRLPHLVDVRRHQLAGALHPAVGRLGQQPAALQPARRRPTASRSATRSSGPGGGPSTTRRRTTAPGRRGRRSTTTTSSTTGATSVIAAPRSPTRRCPTSTCSRPCNASSSPSPTAVPCSRRSTRCRATCRGTASREMIPWSEVGNGSIFNRIPMDHETGRVLEQPARA